MIANNWINIYETIKNGEKDIIDRNSYQNDNYPIGNRVITSSFNNNNETKIKSMSGYTIGLKYLLNNYNINSNVLNSPVTIARKYLKMPVQISNNTRLEEFIQPIQPNKNYVFYFPYYISSDPRIENGSYPVAPIQNEVDGTVLTFPPNVTLVFDPGAFLKLGGTLFNLENADLQGNVPVPSGDYSITSQDVNRQRTILRESEFLWIDIQGEVKASLYQIFKVWNIEYVNFSNQTIAPLKNINKQIFWVQSLGVVRGPHKNKEIYPEWWGAGQHEVPHSVHLGQSHVSPNAVLQNNTGFFQGSRIRNIENRPMTGDQLSIQSCIDASREGQDIVFKNNYIIHQVYIKSNRRYLGYGTTLERPKEYGIQDLTQIDEKIFTDTSLSSRQKAYITNLLFTMIHKHINKTYQIRDRSTLDRKKINLHYKIIIKNINGVNTDQTPTEPTPHSIIVLGSTGNSFPKQLVKNENFIPQNNNDNESNVNSLFIVNEQGVNQGNSINRTHLYGVSINRRVDDLFLSMLDHARQGNFAVGMKHISNYIEPFFRSLGAYHGLSNFNSKIIFLLKKYQEHLSYHKNSEEISSSSLDAPSTIQGSLPEIHLQEFVGWRSNLADGDLFSLEIPIHEISGDLNKNYVAQIEGFTFYSDIQNSGIYDGFNLEHNASVRLHNPVTVREGVTQGLEKQCDVWIKNCNFVGSIGDAIGITTNIRASINNNFFSDCWRGAFSVSGGGDSVFCERLINQDQNLKIQYNKPGTNTLTSVSVPAYSGIESENTGSATGIDGDLRMNMFLNQVYVSGNFDFTFYPHSQIFMSGMISDQSLWKIFFENPLHDVDAQLTQANARIADSIFTTSEYAGPIADGTCALTIRRFGSFYGDQLLFKSKKNPAQKIFIDQRRMQISYDFVGIQINRRTFDKKDAIYNCNIQFQHCQVDVNPNEFGRILPAVGLSLLTYSGTEEFIIQDNDSLIVVSKLLLSPNLQEGIVFNNNITSSLFCMSDKDLVKIEKSYLPNLVGMALDLAAAPILGTDRQPGRLVLNGNGPPWLGEALEDRYETEMVLDQTVRNPRQQEQLLRIFVTVQNTVSDFRKNIIINNINFDSFGARWLYAKVNQDEDSWDSIPWRIQGSDEIPLIAGFRGDTLWRQRMVETGDPISWVCSSTGDLGELEDNSIPNAAWRIYFKE
jgi:hypothetical protein